jgi:DNA repair protein RadC
MAQIKKEEANTCIHQGHRERMRERCVAQSAKSFADHELLEVLLFYSIPRANTNELAHKLLNEFGSLKGILNAPPERLMVVEGIGLVTAQHFHLISEMYQRIQKQKFSPRVKLDSLSALGEFAIAHIGANASETLCAILMDGEMRLIEIIPLSRGSQCQTSFDASELVRLAVLKGAVSVALAHNHPNGVAQPSIHDKAATISAQRALAAVGIALTEHLIVNEIAYCPTMQFRLASATTSNAEKEFYKHFYQN